MKYIRTKDKIIAFGKKYAYPTRPNSRIAFTFQELTEDRFEVMKEYNHWEILSQSENLAELCDLVRFKTKDNATHYIDLHKNTIEDIVVHFGGKNIIIDSFRYCIETSKGLIYVAKMNENGELELI